MTLIVRRYAIVLCAMTALVCVATFFINRMLPRTYGSRAVVAIRQDPVLTLYDRAPALDPQQFYATESEVITSTPVLLSAIERLDRRTLASLGPASGHLAKLRAIVAVSSKPPTFLMNVTAACATPEDAAVIVDAVVHAYAEFRIGKLSALGQEVLSVLRKQTTESSAQLELEQEIVAKLRQDHRDVSNNVDTSDRRTSKLNSLKEALTRARATSIQAQENMESLIALIEKPDRLNEVAWQSSPGTGQTKLAALVEPVQRQRQLQRQVTELSQTLGPAHPRLKAARDELDLITAEIKTIGNSVASIAISDYKSAVQREGDLQRSVELQQDRQATLAAVNTEIERHESETHRLEDLINSTLKKINDLSAWNLQAMGSVTILEPGDINSVPLSPKPVFVLSIAAIAWMMFASLLVFLGEVFDKFIRSTAEIQSHFHIPVVGVIPVMPGDVHQWGKAQEVRLSPGSRTTESFRHAAATLLSNAGESKPRSILVASADKGEGRSLVACNLALTYAQTGRRVLLVDADCRNPSLDRALGVDTSRCIGLGGLLHSQSNDLSKAIVRSPIENLDLMPCGAMSAHTAAMLHSKSFIDFLDTVSADYDLVILDSTAINVASDASLISAATDATIIVVNANHTHRKSLERTRDTLQCTGAKILGVVVNRVKRNDEVWRLKSSAHLTRFIPNQKPAGMKIRSA